MDDIPPPEKQATTIAWGGGVFLLDSPFLSNLGGVLGPSWPLELLRPPEEASFEKDSTGSSAGSYADGKKPRGFVFFSLAVFFFEVIFLNKNPP